MNKNCGTLAIFSLESDVGIMEVSIHLCAKTHHKVVNSASILQKGGSQSMNKALPQTLDFNSPIPVPENDAPKSREYWYVGSMLVFSLAVLE